MQTYQIAGVFVFLALLGGIVWTQGSDQTEVSIVSDEQTIKTITAELATTEDERARGLSDHESLGTDEGMLFVHDTAGNYTYFMREMDFGIDIIFINETCKITRVHEAPAPGPDEDGRMMQYPGYGKYVLEVPQGSLSDKITAGDRIEINGQCDL